MFYLKLKTPMKSRGTCATRFNHVSSTFKVKANTILPLTSPLVYRDKKGLEHLVMLSKEPKKELYQREMIHSIDSRINITNKLNVETLKKFNSLIDNDNHFSHLSMMSIILNIYPDINESQLLSYFYHYIIHSSELNIYDDYVM